MTISTAITALGSHSRLRGIGSERSVPATRKLPKRVFWVAGAALVAAAAVGALRWGMSLRDVPAPSVVQPRAEETSTQAAKMPAPIAQPSNNAKAEASEQPAAKSELVDPLPTGASTPAAKAPTAKAQAAAPPTAQVTSVQKIGAAAAQAASPPAGLHVGKAQSAPPAAKPRPPSAAASASPPKAAEAKSEHESQPIVPPTAAPKAKSSELDSLGGRL